MPGRLVGQLLDAGLVTEAQARASDPDDPLSSPSRVVQRLIAQGLDERLLAGFFVSLGFGPVLHAADLDRADRELVKRLPASDAHDLCAMPLRASPAGTIVAMADPTDERAIERLRHSLGERILPTVARLSDLLGAIDEAYPPDRPTVVSDPPALAEDPQLAELVSTASPVWDAAWDHSTTERDLPAALATEADVSVRLDDPPEASSFTNDPHLDAELAELAHASSRDEAVRMACRACLRFARASAFLALRQGAFRGWDGAGDSVTGAGIRSLWIPATNPSVLEEVLYTGESFRGFYGEVAADRLLRTALGSRGRAVGVVPVRVASRLVGVLCADDPAVDLQPLDRIGSALAEAFEGLILARKSRI